MPDKIDNSGVALEILRIIKEKFGYLTEIEVVELAKEYHELIPHLAAVPEKEKVALQLLGLNSGGTLNFTPKELARVFLEVVKTLDGK